MKTRQHSPARHMAHADLATLFAPPQVDVERRGEDCLILRHRIRLTEENTFAGAGVMRWAETDPSRIWLAERATTVVPWTTLSYGAARDRIIAVATALLGLGLSAERPVLVLSANSVDVAILTFACYFIGVPISSISPSFSLHLTNTEKFRGMVRLINPGLLYASDNASYGPALDVLNDIVDCPTVTSDHTTLRPRHTPFALLAGQEGDADLVSAATDRITPDTVARLLFTSGSTGTPKAVINTHRNICANMAALSICWPFQNAGERLSMLEWLPWSHIFGSKNLLLSARNGWSFYLDRGRPTSSDIDITIANLKDVRPGFYNNVPLGYDMLLEAMRQDEELAEAFYSNLKLTFYAGSALNAATWKGLQEIATRIKGYPVPMITQWGATETGPTSTDSHSLDPQHMACERSGNVGIPVPGTELKLVRSADKWEARLRGPCITPGYWKNPEATAQAFDEEGFYKTGDILRFADENNPVEGLYFDGRIAEDFKLSSGTWVSVGDLRLKAIDALSPVVADLVVTGHERAEVGLLLFPNVATCRKLTGLADDAPLETLLNHPVLRAHIQKGLQKLARTGGGVSRYATRARLLRRAPDATTGEITEKGSINQRAVLRNRTDDVAALQGDRSEDWIGLK